MSAVTSVHSVEAQSFIDTVNSEYEQLHKAFELQFWGTKMALKDECYRTEELTRTKSEMEAFLASTDKLETARGYLADPDNLSGSQQATLKLFERTFGCYIMESPEARALRKKSTNIEGKLESARNSMVLGAALPSKSNGGDAEFEEMSSVQLRTTMRVSSDEGDREACYHGLGKIGEFALENGFVDLVRARNQMAKALDFEDYYDYKVTGAEGFGKKALFEILDVLERETRPLMERSRKRLAEEMGEAALDPWNTGFMMAGDVVKKMDPYFPFEKSIEMWGRSFAKMGIGYSGASMDLDLLDRKRKYSNGFCHWPQPAWVKPDGSFQPSRTHFTSLADPNGVGSGLTGLVTLMHEAGHAAHFANIRMPSPLFSQERAPTSVPYAELQSMLLDSLVGDASWRRLYALNRAGEPLPFETIEEDIRANHPYKVMALRSMLAVPYFEKRLYELSDDDLTAEKISALANEVEMEIQGGLSARPLLSVPHLLSDEASCYYHGYVLAEMAVHQTRAFFIGRDGFMVNNPSVGPTLTEVMWNPGNSRPFLELVEELTGQPLSCDAWVKSLEQDVDELVHEEKAAYAKAGEKTVNDDDGDEDIDLDMRVRIVDGDEVIADSQALGSFVKTCTKFEEYIQDRYQKSE